MIKDFLTWWGQQLKELLPSDIKSQLRRELCLLYLDLTRDGLSIHASYRGQQDTFGDVQLDQQTDEHPLFQQWLNSLIRQPDRILLRIARGRYISREIELPLAAEQNLAESIGFQIEQLTPFSADQVLCFSGLVERLPNEKKLRAWLAVTPTDQVDKALQVLGGTPPTPVGMPRQKPPKDGPMEIAFRPFGQSEAHGYRSTMAITFALILSLALAATLHVHNRVDTREHLQTAVADASKQANLAADLRSSVEQQHTQSRELAAVMRETPTFSALWADLSQRLDDETWLQRIDVRDDKLTLQGVSSNAPQLLEQLEASPWLENVSFASSVTRDRASNKDRFNINATFDPDAGPES